MDISIKKKHTEEEQSMKDEPDAEKMPNDMKDGHNTINSFNSTHTRKEKHCLCIFASQEHLIYSPPFSH